MSWKAAKIDANLRMAKGRVLYSLGRRCLLRVAPYSLADYSLAARTTSVVTVAVTVVALIAWFTAANGNVLRSIVAKSIARAIAVGIVNAHTWPICTRRGHEHAE